MTQLTGLAMGKEYEVHVNPTQVRYVLENPQHKGTTIVVFDANHKLYIQGECTLVAERLGLARNPHPE